MRLSEPFNVVDNVARHVRVAVMQPTGINMVRRGDVDWTVDSVVRLEHDQVLCLQANSSIPHPSQERPDIVLVFFGGGCFYFPKLNSLWCEAMAFSHDVINAEVLLIFQHGYSNPS